MTKKFLDYINEAQEEKDDEEEVGADVSVSDDSILNVDDDLDEDFLNEEFHLFDYRINKQKEQKSPMDPKRHNPDTAASEKGNYRITNNQGDNPLFSNPEAIKEGFIPILEHLKAKKVDIISSTLVKVINENYTSLDTNDDRILAQLFVNLLKQPNSNLFESLQSVFREQEFITQYQTS